MTEEEYIVVSDRRTVSVAIETLADIVPNNSSLIREDDYKQVMATLTGWLRAMDAVIGDDLPVSGVDRTA